MTFSRYFVEHFYSLMLYKYFVMLLDPIVILVAVKSIKMVN